LLATPENVSVAAMLEVEFSVPQKCDLKLVERLIEEICAGRGLQVAMKGSQSKFPGSVHWHYKREKQKGTLELTLFPASRRLWAKVAKGRKAPWIDLELPPLRREVEKKLKVLPC
jgi:hypothetical protein